MTNTPARHRRSYLRGGLLAAAGMLVLIITLPIVLWGGRHLILNHSLVRAWLLDQAEVELGLRPRWQGELRLEWSKDLVVTLGAGELPNPPGFSAAPLLAWDQLQWSMNQDALRELWRTGDLHILKVEIDTLRLHGETNASGAANWQALFPGPDTRPNTRVKIDGITLSIASIEYWQPEQNPISLSIERLVVENLQRDVQDHWQIKNIELETTDRAQFKLHNFLLIPSSQDTTALNTGITTEWQVQNVNLRQFAMPNWANHSSAPLVIASAAGRLISLTLPNSAAAPSATGDPATDQNPTMLEKLTGKLQVDSLQIDDVQLRGSLTMRPQSTVIDLAIPRLRLDPFLASGDRAWSEPTLGGNPSSLMAQLPLETLRDLGLAGVIRIEELSWGRDRLTGVAIRLTP